MTLKLYTNWIEKASEKIRIYKAGKNKTIQRISPKDIKAIYNLIKLANVIENNPDFVVYEI